MKITESYASHNRVADSTSVSSTVCRLRVERLMTLSTSAVVACCSLASISSRRSCAISLSWLAADELRGRAAAVPLGRFGAAALRRRDLTDPALERPLMAFPEAQ
jgi:hypothetical protein